MIINRHSWILTVLKDWKTLEPIKEVINQCFKFEMNATSKKYANHYEKYILSQSENYHQIDDDERTLSIQSITEDRYKPSYEKVIRKIDSLLKSMNRTDYHFFHSLQVPCHMLRPAPLLLFHHFENHLNLHHNIVIPFHGLADKHFVFVF